jgi:dehydrogenase/reductase SDR family protein 1
VVHEQNGRLDGLVNNAYGGVTSIAEHIGKSFWEKPLSVWDASHTVGLRSHYVASALVVPQMLQQSMPQKGIIVNISSSGGAGYLFDIAYGVGKQGLDRMGADMATELNGSGITVLTLWPGAVITETTSFLGGETVEFSGRAIGALFRQASRTQLEGYNGKVVMTTELASTFGFTDVNGTVPGIRGQQQKRAEMESVVPVQWSQTAPLHPSTDPSLADFFAKVRATASKL